jgi:hypothetical protein
MSVKSESAGLAKLTEYLNQTRKQAELSIDILNKKISELEVENERLSGEKDYFHSLTLQLKIENSKKWRLQERDDWKSLVDSIQIDRSRLQNVCNNLGEE